MTMKDDSIETFLRDPEGSEASIARCFLQLLDPTTSQLEIAKFLVYLHESGRDRDPAVIAQAVTVLKEVALEWPLSETGDLSTQGEVLEQLTDRKTVCVDIVGTGGDGHNTYNVSTTAAIVAAGVPGVRVIKHGNKASTSSSGSADILRSYGCNLLLSPNDIPALKSSFLFLLAPIWNPALANVAAIRKSLPHPTIFNILGPLLNPAPIDARIIGVHSPELGQVFIDAFAQLNPRGRCMIVCGDERLDEISPAGTTNIWTYDDITGIQRGQIDPSMFGMARHSLDSVRGGTPEENASVLNDILGNKREIGDAVLDYVLINCAALLYVSGIAKGYSEGIQLSLESIRSGRAKDALDRFRDEGTAASTP